MPIWLLSVKTLVNKRVFFSLLLLVTIASLLLLVLSSAAIHGIKAAIYEKSALKFGNHQLVMNDLTAAKAKTIKADSDVKASGEATLAGSYLLSESPKEIYGTIGYMDEQALKIGHIQLLTGDFPDERDKVAIESAYADILDVKIGDCVTLKADSQDSCYRISGIVKDYSSYWTVPDYLVKGTNELPNLFVNRDKIQSFKQQGKTKSNLLVVLKNDSPETANIFMDKNKVKSEDAYFNFNRYDRGLSDYRILSKLSTSFNIIIVIAVLFSVYHIYMTVHAHYKKSMAIFMAVGATGKRLYHIAFLQCLFIILCSSVVAVPIGLALSSLFISLTYGGTGTGFFLPAVIVGRMILWIVMIFLILLLSSVFSLRKQLRHSIVQGLNDETTLFTRNHSLYEKISGLPFALKYLIIQITGQLKSKAIAVISISFGIILLFFTQLYAGETESTGHGPDYYLASKITTVSKTINGFQVVLNQNDSFDPAWAAELERMKGVQAIDKKTYAQGTNMLLEDNQLDPFLSNWRDRYSGRVGEYVSMPELPDRLTIIPNTDFIAVNDDSFQYLNSKYLSNEQSLSEFKKGKSILLFYPINDSERPDAGKVGLKKGDLVRLGRIELDRGSESQYRYRQWEYEVGGVILQPFAIQSGEHFRTSDRIVAVVHENDLGENSAFRGYESLEIYVQDRIDEDSMNKIDKAAKRLAAYFPGSLFYSDREQSQKEKSLINTLLILGQILFVIITLFTAISVSLILYSTVMLKQKEYATLRAIGMSLRKLKRFLYLETMVYSLAAFLISGIFIFIQMYSSSPSKGVSHYWMYYYIAVGITFGCIMVSTFIPLRGLGRFSLSDKLRSEN